MNNQEKNKIRILIATGIYPPDVGGPATLLTELPQSLIKRGFGVKVITYSDAGSTEQDRREKIVYRISRRQCSTCRQAKYFWQMLRLAFWADLIYATDTYSVGYFAYLIKKFTGKKYILRFAGDSAWETAVANNWTQDYIVDFQKKKYNLAIEKMKQRRAKILINAERVIAVSNFIAGLAKLIGVAENKIRVIYNAVDFFGQAPDKNRPATPVLVYSGRLMPWKGLEMMLRVLARLKTRWPEIIFEILGDGPEGERLKELARKLGIENNVEFRGRISEPATHDFFARSTVFVLNTNYEGLPHSILNAMACGLPVITTPVGGNPEVVQGGVNGLLAPYNDESAWQEAIERLLVDEALQQKFIENGKKTLENFRWEKLVDETVAAINSLV